jgi:hypothetical protein
VDTSVQRFSVVDALGDPRAGVRLKLTRFEVAPASAGDVCAGEFDVRNDGPAIPPGAKDVFGATVEIFDNNGAPLFRGHVARAGSRGMPAGEVGTARWDTKSNALDRAADGTYQRFTFPRPGEYAARVTLTREGLAAPLDVRDLTIKVGARAAAPAPGQAQPQAAPLVPSPGAVPPPPLAARDSGLRVAYVRLTAVSAGLVLTGEVVVRNDGPDIRPDARAELLAADVEVRRPDGTVLFRNRFTRAGVGVARAESVRVKFDTRFNAASPAGRPYPPFVIPAAGDYLAAVTLYRPGHVRAADVYVQPFTAGEAEVAPKPVPEPAPDLPRTARRTQSIAPAPTALRVEGMTVDGAAAGATLSGRFVVRNTGRSYLNPPGVRPAAWRVTVEDEQHQALFETSGSWGPGLRESEGLEITWDTLGRRPFVLPRAGQYTVRVELFAGDDRRRSLNSSATQLIATPARR